jgi:hypothetical protein
MMPGTRNAFWLTALLALACSSDTKDLPDTYGIACQADAGQCAPSLTCLPAPEAAGGAMACSARCRSDTDCPTWSEEGHCAGTYHTPCREGICGARWACD